MKQQEKIFAENEKQKDENKNLFLSLFTALYAVVTLLGTAPFSNFVAHSDNIFQYFIEEESNFVTKCV